MTMTKKEKEEQVQRVARINREEIQRYIDDPAGELRVSSFRTFDEWWEAHIVSSCRKWKLDVPPKPDFMSTNLRTVEMVTMDSLIEAGQKLEVTDIGPGHRVLATEWLLALPTPIDFEFLRDMRFRVEAENKVLTTAQVKGVLNCALADVRRSAATPPAPETGERMGPGMYALPDPDTEAGVKVYKVQAAVHGSGYLYAKLLNPMTGRFEFERGAIRKLKPEHKMTLEQAKRYGAIYGVCCVCGATLTNEDSIEAGIGPVCAGKLEG